MSGVSGTRREGKLRENLLDEVEQTVFEIARSKSDQSFFPINTIITDTFKSVEKLFERKELVTGVPSGYDEFDKMTAGLQSSDLIILAGRPSMGKTALAMNMVQNAAIHHKIPVAVFSSAVSRLSAETEPGTRRVRWLVVRHRRTGSRRLVVPGVVSVFR